MSNECSCARGHGVELTSATEHGEMSTVRGFSETGS